MRCGNELCDPETGNDCEVCFNARMTPFRMACEARKTELFQDLQAKYLEAQKLADVAFLELRNTFQFDGICWITFGAPPGEVFPEFMDSLVMD